MSQHYKGLAVVLAHDVGEEQIEQLASAISLLHGVVEVRAIPAGVSEDHWTERRVRRDISERMYTMAEEVLRGEVAG